MKRWIALLLLVGLLGSILSGCGTGTGETNPLAAESTQPAQSQQEIQQTPAENSVTVEPIVVYDANGVKVTANGLETGFTGTDLKLLVENSTDRNLALSGMDVVVNGVTMTGYLYIDVAAGKKANGSLSLYADTLETAGITQIARIEAKDAALVDTDSYETVSEASFAVTTSLGQDYVQPLDENGELLYEAEGVSVTAKVVTEAFYGNTVLLYVKNTTSRDVIVQAENISVNGFTLDAWMYDTVYAGTVRFSELDLFSSGLEENGITQIEEISFTLSMVDPATFETIARSEELKVLVS